MSMGGGGRGGMGRGVGNRDAEVQRAENAAAPRIPHLYRRIGELFRPYASQLTITITLVLVSAGLGVLFVLFAIAVAAAEAAVGLALVIAIYRHRRSVRLEEVSTLKG